MINHKPPTISIVWHDSPEAVHRAMWGPVATANGFSYEEIARVSCMTAAGKEVEMSVDEAIAAIRDQKVWGFADVDARKIHAWRADDAEPEAVLRMLAHEVGHLTGVPCKDDLAEERRADAFADVAAMAFRMMQRWWVKRVADAVAVAKGAGNGQAPES